MSSTSRSSTFPTRRTTRSGKLYTTVFYRLLARHLTRGGAFVVQSTSPLFARKSFWCIVETSSRRASDVAVPRLRAVVRRVGLRHWPAAPRYTPPTTLPGLRFLTGRHAPDALRLSRRTWPRPDASQPPDTTGAGPLLERNGAKSAADADAPRVLRRVRRGARRLCRSRAIVRSPADSSTTTCRLGHALRGAPPPVPQRRGSDTHRDRRRRHGRACRPRGVCRSADSIGSCCWR